MSPELLVEFKSACLVLTRPRRAAPRKLCGFHAKFLGSGGYYVGGVNAGSSTPSSVTAPFVLRVTTALNSLRGTHSKVSHSERIFLRLRRGRARTLKYHTHNVFFFASGRVNTY